VRRTIMWAALAIAAAVVETTWLDALRIGGGVPNITLLLVVYFAITEGEERAMYTGVLGGIFQDVAGDARLGHHVLCHAIVGFVIGRLSARLVTDHPAVKAGLVFCASLIHGILFTVIQYVQDPGATRVMNSVIAVVLPSAFYTGIVAPVVFFMLDLAFGRPGPVPARGSA